MNHVILLSGGTGSRINSDIPKQYIKKDGMMMVTRALKILVSCGRTDDVFIVADKEWREALDENIKESGVDVSKLKGYVDPGESRQGSVKNGLEAVEKSCGASGISGDTVLVHDAARPFITLPFLERCYEALPGHDGVMPVLPMKDTIYRSAGGKSVSELLNRDELFAGQAPELFDLTKYIKANRALYGKTIDLIRGASEPAVLAGMDIVMIPGDEGNFKVTTDSDLERYFNKAGGESI